ncbi:hypothetical protein FQA39_LY06565 [Lamprigera yunnana]|nr:hypothetical protein FQA39_LY06565 [Lamprigera yunnana]
MYLLSFPQKNKSLIINTNNSFQFRPSKMKCLLVFAIVVTFLGVKFVKKSSNNVCRTFDDYYTDRDKNSNCYYNPDIDLLVQDIVKRHGYPIQTHHVTTDDGYTLTIFRIQNDTSPNKKKNPVFLQHGFGSSSASFVARQKKSLGLFLADRGYDVWLGNFRGTAYSTNHSKLTIMDSRFWNFSVHEHGVYDLPAQLSYVKGVTNKKILYIGYSLGTMAMYIYGVTYPEKTVDEIELFINLAPAAYLNNTRSLARYVIPYWYLIEPIIQSATNGYLFARVCPKHLLKYICYPYPIQLKICQIPEMILGGFSNEQTDPETLPVHFMQNADWASIKVFSHLSQFVHKDRFESYDYGVKENKKHYGSPFPIFYNLSKIRIPTYFIRGEEDYIITKENVEYLYNSLPKEARPKYIYVIKNFNHYDFIGGKDVIPMLYNHILNILKKY